MSGSGFGVWGLRFSGLGGDSLVCLCFHVRLRTQGAFEHPPCNDFDNPEPDASIVGEGETLTPNS